MTELLAIPEAIATSARRIELAAQYPGLDDARAAIEHAVRRIPAFQMLDFLSTWRDGAWDEIEQAYPEYLERCK